MIHCEIPNNIVIIGGDHHNTLAVIRCLGEKNCKISILFHADVEKLSMIKASHSKYARKKSFLIKESESDIIDWLLQHKNTFNRGTILFPCSDLAAYAIDMHYAELNDHYIMPGFVGTPGKVALMMDKNEQKKFAIDHKLPMAKTWLLELPIDISTNSIDEVIFPCIIKPNISAFGSKSDIEICNTREELIKGLNKFSSKGYETILVQQFLKKKYEVCSYGCLTSQGFVGGVIRKMRESIGSTVFAEFL